LKSLLYLQKNHSESEEYISSLEIFNQFFQENNSKIKENVSSILKNYLPVIFNQAKLNELISNGKEKINSFYSNDVKNNPFEKVLFTIRNFTYFPTGQIDLSEVEKIIMDSVKNDKVSLRRIISEQGIYVEVFLSMFCSEDTLKKFKV